MQSIYLKQELINIVTGAPIVNLAVVHRNDEFERLYNSGYIHITRAEYRKLKREQRLDAEERKYGIR